MKILVDIDSFYRGFSLLLLISTDSIPHVFLLGSEVDFLKIRRKGRICPMVAARGWFGLCLS
jgi:hypothetical protein